VKLTTNQIDRIIDAQRWSEKEKDAVRKRAHGGDGHALFVLATIEKRKHGEVK